MEGGIRLAPAVRGVGEGKSQVNTVYCLAFSQQRVSQMQHYRASLMKSSQCSSVLEREQDFVPNWPEYGVAAACHHWARAVPVCFNFREPPCLGMRRYKNTVPQMYSFGVYSFGVQKYGAFCSSDNKSDCFGE